MVIGTEYIELFLKYPNYLLYLFVLRLKPPRKERKGASALADGEGTSGAAGGNHSDAESDSQVKLDYPIKMLCLIFYF